MTYIPEEAKVVYQSKDGKEEKIFDVLEWLAAMCCHVPNKGEQMVRYVGFYSNVMSGFMWTFSIQGSTLLDFLEEEWG